mmetsp:Transcript_25409/g.43424  ORF Transcript_25409/g.43424 Transcript_25409/m.43424 type:complete len:875 (-) Transcript_25409:33-2657(-)
MAGCRAAGSPPWRGASLQLVLELGERRDRLLEALALARGEDDLDDLVVAAGEGVAVDRLPVVEDHLREGLARRVLAEEAGEAEGLGDGQVGLDVVQRRARAVGLLDDGAALAVERRVDAAHRVLGTLDLDHEDGLLQPRRGRHHRSKEDAARRGDDLPAAAVDRVRVQRDVHDVDADVAEGLVAERALLADPLPAGDDRVLDLVEVLHADGHVDDNVRAGAVGAEAPDLLRGRLVPAELVDQNARARLRVHLGLDVALLDGVGERLLVVGDGVAHRLGLAVEAVVLVGRLGHAGARRLGGDRLAVRHDGVGDDDRRAVHEVLREVLEADLNVQLAAARDDVLARLLHGALHERVGLGEALEALDELGQVVGVLRRDGDAHDGRHRVLHRDDGVRLGRLGVGDGALLHEVLVDADQRARVARGDGVDGLGLAAHHEDGALDILDEEVLLLALHVVGAHDLDLGAGAHRAGEDAAEGEEAALVGRRDELRDVHHQRTVRVAVADGVAVDVVRRAGVEGVRAVLLRHHRRRQVLHKHLEERVVGREPLLHAALQERLLAKLEVLLGQRDANGAEHLRDGVVILIHAVLEDLGDGREAEHAVRALEAGRRLVGVELPLLLLGGEVVVAPQALHHLVHVGTKLLRVHAGELGEREGPAVQACREGDGALGRVDHAVAEGVVVVRRDEDVDVLDVLDEGGVHVLRRLLELEEGAVELVDRDDGLDALAKGLAQHGLGLHAHALDAVDDHERAVGHAERGRHLGGEVNVTGRVDQVDQELVADRVSRELVVRLGLEEKRDAGRLDGNATVLLVLAGIGQAGVAGRRRGNDTGRRDQRVGEGRLAVIDVRNDGHVTDVRRLALNSLELVHREIDHGDERSCG